jgi:macrophage erythroblast attacher
MANPDNAAIKHADHMLLEHSMMRTAQELLRNNFRSAHVMIEREISATKSVASDTAKALAAGRITPTVAAQTFDTQIARLKTARAKLAALADEEASIHQRLSCRAAHLDQLMELRTIDDPGYQDWSRIRLDRLIIDYLLRHGIDKTGLALAKDRGMEDMIDGDIYRTRDRIRQSLVHQSVTEALQWVSENKKELRKVDSKLEFMLRLQQFIELVRLQSQPKLMEAIAHAKKYLVPYKNTYGADVQQACGLLCAPVPAPAPAGVQQRYFSYRDMWTRDRWDNLSLMFLKAYNTIMHIPTFPLLHTALASGLSALKTPACHSTSGAVPQHGGGAVVASPEHTMCPICSTELHELARHVPYAQHSQSHIEPDQMLLPNGRAYGLKRLTEHARQASLDPKQTIRDPRTGEIYAFSTLRKVYIS